MRGSEAVELAGEFLPRRWRRVVGPVAVCVLLLTGTLDDVVRWFVQDKAAGITEDSDPMIERLQHTGPKPAQS